MRIRKAKYSDVPDGQFRCSKCKNNFPLSENRIKSKRRREHHKYGTCYSCHRTQNHELIIRRRHIVFNHYGYKCACCGESEFYFLSIDHINGGGSQHRRDIKGPLYLWLIRNNFPSGFQTLCYNCNLAKGHHGFCPHKPPKYV